MLSETTQNQTDKLMAARCRLMMKNPWYGHMALGIDWRASSMSWIRDEARRSLGVRFTSNGGIVAYYYPQWVQSKSLAQLYGSVEHVLNHLIRLHSLRSSGKHPVAWMIACDMAVNGKKSAPWVGYIDSNDKRILPEDNMIWVPEEWDPNQSAEWYHDKILDEEPDPQSNGQDDDGFGSYMAKYGGFGGMGIDDHSVWSDSDISQDEARQIIAERVRDATEKSQGSVPGHLKQAIEQLKEPMVRWREVLRQYIGNHVGNRRKTYSRANRRQPEIFGLKGVSRHSAAEVVVICDTSGSMGITEIEQCFSEIEAISYRAKIYVLEWDAGFQSFYRYRKGDWKKIKPKGGGGTDMSAPVEWLEENGKVADLNVMLTDGYCNWPGKRSFPMVFCITTPANSGSSSPDWGQVVRMK
jgi:predicted metal-dependent peptidase